MWGNDSPSKPASTLSATLVLVVGAIGRADALSLDPDTLVSSVERGEGGSCGGWGWLMGEGGMAGDCSGRADAVEVEEVAGAAGGEGGGELAEGL